MEPDSPLLELGEEMPTDVFAPELDFMILENVYLDLWERTQVLDRRTRSIVTLGLLMGLPNHEALRTHILPALRNGLTVPELAEFVYQAATYLVRRVNTQNHRCGAQGGDPQTEGGDAMSTNFITPVGDFRYAR